jgi:hypothetical protein
MKSIIWSKTTFIIACLVLLSMTACRQKSSPSGGKQLSAEEYAKMKAEAAVDSVALQESKGASQDTALFTYAMAMEIVQPRYKCDEKLFSSLFDDLNLPMQYSERYISDADWGGDSPAISYCFGDNVKYEEFNLVPTAGKYYGVHTNFFFDDSRKTGFMNRFAIITSDTLWHNNLMKDAEADGLKFKEDVDPNVYGKKGKLFQKPAAQGKGASENANYYIFHFSTPGRVDLEVGYDTGIDI